MAERVTVKRAAEILGMTPLTVQYGVKTGELPIGHAIKSQSGLRTNIYISPHLLSKLTGLSVEEIKGGEQTNEKI